MAAGADLNQEVIFMLYQKYSNIFHCKYSGYTHKENMHIK
jgi:hypothetical protein